MCSVDPKHWLLTAPCHDNQRNNSEEGFSELMLARGMQLLKVTPVRNHLETLFSLLKLKTDQPAANEAT